MERRIDQDLILLRTRIVEMGGHVERAVEDAVRALVTLDTKKVDRVLKIEEEINLAHVEVDEACLGLLAKQAPLASDLRTIVAIIKINTDLERMGDQAVNISLNAKDYISRTQEPVTTDFSPMSATVRTMIRGALDAFIERDFDLAHDIMKKDDIVDQLKSKIFTNMHQRMRQDSTFVRQGLDQILIARNLERLADHATNIAEDVIFMVTGEDVRHGGLHQKTHSGSDDSGPRGAP